MKICDVEDQLCLFDPDGSAGKTCRVCSAAVHPSLKTSGSSSKRSRELYAIPYLSLDLTPGHGNMLGEPTWELNSPWLGGSLMLNTGPAPLNGGGVSSLSQILVDAPPLKYYLSRRACRGVLRRMVKRGKPQPFSLVLALVIQGALIPRNRVPELLSLILSAQESEETCMILDHGEEDDASENHRVFAAGFSAGAGASAGSIGYSEQVAPTLKGSPSDNCMPSVLCLNDQGGDIKAAEAALPAASAEITEWKEDVLYQLLEKVTVLDEARIKVTFRSGVEIEQALEKDERSVTA